MTLFLKRSVVCLFVLGLFAAAAPVGNYDAESVLMSALFLFGSLCCVLLFCLKERSAMSMAGGWNTGFLFFLGFSFWALAAVSILLSDMPTVSFVYFIIFSFFPVGFLCVFCALRLGFLTLRGLMVAVALFSAALIANGFIQYLFFHDYLKFGLVHWPLANPNSMAALLSCLFFACVGGVLAGAERAHKIIFLVLAVCLFAAFVLTGSRGGFVALVIGVLVLMGCLFAQCRAQYRYVTALVVGCVGAFVVLELFVGNNTLGQTLMDGSVSQAAHLWNREVIWAAGWQMFQDDFWVGRGIGTFAFYYPEYRDVADMSSGLAAHSDPLQFAIEMGVFAPVLFYAFVGAALVMSVRALLNVEGMRRVLIVVPFCALGAFLLHTHITFHFYIPVLLVVSGAVLAVWLYGVLDGREARVLTGQKGAKVIYTFALVALTIAMVCFVSLQMSHVYARKATEARDSGDFDGFVYYINRADKISGGRNANALIYAASLSLSVLEADDGSVRMEQLREAYARGMDLLDKAYALNPKLPAVEEMRARFDAYNF